jgi:hypothetical protein
MAALPARSQDAVDAFATWTPEVRPVDADFVAPVNTAAAASPALALQRQLSDAVLQGWCEPRVTSAPGLSARQMSAIATCAAASWAVMFGAGWALLA